MRDDLRASALSGCAPSPCSARRICQGEFSRRVRHRARDGLRQPQPAWPRGDAAVGRPESLLRRRDTTRIEEACGLRDDVRETLVVRVGEGPLERRRLDARNRQDGDRERVPPNGIAIRADERAASRSMRSTSARRSPSISESSSRAPRGRSTPPSPSGSRRRLLRLRAGRFAFFAAMAEVSTRAKAALVLAGLRQPPVCRAAAAAACRAAGSPRGRRSRPAA